MIAEPIRVLAEDQLSGSWALAAAIVSSALPVIFVSGVLVVWVLRARRADGYEARAFRIGLGLSLIIATLFALGLAPFWGRLLHGETLVGEVTSTERVSRRFGGEGFQYTITLADGRMLEESVEPEHTELMIVGQRVHVRAIRGVRGFERLGDEATFGELTLGLSVAVWGFLIVIGLVKK